MRSSAAISAGPKVARPARRKSEIAGSDGYTNNSVLISDQKVDTVEISVPGGAGGVQDVITLSIDDVVVRTTSLVFGF
jgi:hypothetical protein